MLNYRRNRSYNSGTPNSCAVSMFGLGVVLTLGGIVLMVVTKNTKHKDEPIIRTSEHDDKENLHYNDNFYKRNRNRHTNINNTLKTLGPIFLGVGITIIVLFFCIITAVAWGRGLKASTTNSQFPPAIDHSPNIASAQRLESSYDCNQSSHVNPSTPMSKASNSQRGDYSMHSTAGLGGPLLERPPAYDEICIQQLPGEKLRKHEGYAV